MAKPTPVEEWTLGIDLVTHGDQSLQVKIGAYSTPENPYIYVDFESAEEIVIQKLSPEQARALATMLLYAAEQVDPSGD